MKQREVLFRVRETHHKGQYVIDVYPYLKNIFYEDGGEAIILAIASNCIRTLANRDGLEGALDRLTRAVLHHTTAIRDKWPWE